MKVEAKWTPIAFQGGMSSLKTVKGGVCLGMVVRSVRHGYYAYMGEQGRTKLGRSPSIGAAKKKVERALQ